MTSLNFTNWSFKAIRGAGRVQFSVIETHGWWDDKGNVIVNSVDTLRPEESDRFPNYAEAHERYIMQRQHRARSGFVHAFSLDMLSDKNIYEEITIEGS